jgi:hypothetical protein
MGFEIRNISDIKGSPDEQKCSVRITAKNCNITQSVVNFVIFIILWGVNGNGIILVMLNFQVTNTVSSVINYQSYKTSIDILLSCNDAFRS